MQEGAAAYLRRQSRTVTVYVALLFFLLLLLPADTSAVRWGRSAFFLVGILFSAVTGFTSLSLAVRGNVRVAESARASGEWSAMRIAFRTGGVAGMFTPGLSLFGAAIIVLIYRASAVSVLEGFGLGAALSAMFMRIGGGIFANAADVGANLVGLVERGIPEDDPRNAATIADDVGDNVGDCAGMAADFFESYSVMLVASLILGVKAFGPQGLVFPLIVSMIGVISAALGIFTVAPRTDDPSSMTGINRAFFVSAILSLVLVVAAAFLYLPAKFGQLSGITDAAILQRSGSPRWLAVGAVLTGLILASAMQLLTGYFTGMSRRPVQGIAESSLTGPATVLLSGISVGLESAVYSVLLIGTAIYAAFLLGAGNPATAIFAVALTGMGLLTTVGVIVSMATFGPVCSNARGIAIMSGDVRGEAVFVLQRLDDVGDVTKAITRGIAITTAIFAAIALLGAFWTEVGTALGKAPGSLDLSVDRPNVLVGLMIGAAVVFLFSSLSVRAVGRAAAEVVIAVRNQFRIHPGIMDYTERPDYGRVVDICTRASLRELAAPSLLVVLTPITVGFALGYTPLGSMLVGAIAAGALMAVFMANSGGAWKTATKLVAIYRRGSDSHAATVIADAVGGPFKDTAGPNAIAFRC